MEIKAELQYFNNNTYRTRRFKLDAHTTENDAPRCRGIEVSLAESETGESRFVFIPFSALKRLKEFIK